MKMDLHVHTSEISRCGHLTAEETIRLYREAGYDAIVITNHFSRGTADFFVKKGVPDFTGRFFQAVREAAVIGKRYGLTVLSGMEVHFDENGNDYLVYGMPESEVADFDAVFKMGAEAFSRLAASKKALFYQAHPFRDGLLKVMETADLFGLEVLNCNPRHDDHNDKAAQWARDHHLHAIAGSDCHRVEDVGTAGIITERTIGSEAELLAMLRADDYRIFKSDTANG